MSTSNTIIKKTANDVDLPNLVNVANVGLSRNKAVILYANSLMEFYKNTEAKGI